VKGLDFFTAPQFFNPRVLTLLAAGHAITTGFTQVMAPQEKFVVR
jgi:hypothetical protein